MQKKLWMRSLTAWLSRATASQAAQPSRRKARPTPLSLESLEDRNLLSAGALDTSFNVVGKATAGFDLGGSKDDTSHGSALQSDGKIVVVGAAATSPGDPSADFAIARFNPNGTLDTTFNTTGKVVVPFNLGGANEDRAYSVAIQSDGKIVVGGFAQRTAVDFDFAAIRLNIDGNLDTTFGTLGKVNFTFGNNPGGPNEDEATSTTLAITPTGAILLAGRVQSSSAPLSFDVGVARLTSAGVLDNTFGTGGGLEVIRVTSGTGAHDDEADGLVVQADSKIVVSGFASPGVGSKTKNFAVVRLNVNGGLDATFGSGGIVSFNFNLNTGSNQNNNEATSVTIDPYSRIVVAGFAQRSDITTSTFTTVGGLSTGAGPVAAAEGDFNGDQKLDLVVVNATTGTVSILLGNGNGSFQGQTTAAVGAGANGVVVGDFNGDGKADIAVTNGTGNTVSLLLGNGNGTFLAQSTFATGIGPSDPAAGDFNKDGKLDLAYLTATGNVGILFGNGNGTFLPEVPVVTGISGTSLTTADFNNDLNTDLAVGDTVNSRGVVLLGTGTGTFVAQPTFALGTNPTALATGDMNRDGFADLIALSANGNVSVLLGNGNGTFQAQSTFATTSGNGTEIAIGDFNNDGALDVAVPNSTSGIVTILQGANNGRLLPFQTFAVGANPVSVITGDFNGDQASDLIATVQGANSVTELVNVPPQGNFDFAIARLNQSGAFDTLFGVGGMRAIAFDLGAANDDEANSVIVQIDGKIVVSGFAQTSPNSYNFAITRLKPNGLEDDSFNLTGRSVFQIINGGFSSEDVATSMLIQPNGNIVLAGYAQTIGNGFDFAVARLTGLNWLAITGDWTGKGFDSIGLYEPTTSTFFLRNSNTSGNADITIQFGPGGQGWIPVAGNWTGTLGFDSIGLYNPLTSTFFLKNSLSGGNADSVVAYGPQNQALGWLPVMGRWLPGQTADTEGLYDPVGSIFYLRNSNTPGNAEEVFQYGPPGAGWRPIAGDWTTKGFDSVGLYDPFASFFFLKNTNQAGNADFTFPYGPPGANWVPVHGRWVSGQTNDTIGLYDGPDGFWFLRNSNNAGNANETFQYGPPGVGGPAEQLAGASATGAAAAGLTADQLNFIVGNALLRFQGIGLSQDQLNNVFGTNFVITDLAANEIGRAVGSTIYLSRNAAGYGWFVDPTPGDNSEFAAGGFGLPLAALPGGPASGKIDALTVVLHELAHEAGVPDVLGDGSSLMAQLLMPGIRRTDVVDAVFVNGVN